VGREPTLLFLLQCREGNLRKTLRTDPEEGFNIASIKLDAVAPQLFRSIRYLAFASMTAESLLLDMLSLGVCVRASALA
jgi:hypothetical protein